MESEAKLGPILTLNNPIKQDDNDCLVESFQLTKKLQQSFSERVLKDKCTMIERESTEKLLYLPTRNLRLNLNDQKISEFNIESSNALIIGHLSMESHENSLKNVISNVTVSISPSKTRTQSILYNAIPSIDESPSPSQKISFNALPSPKSLSGMSSLINPPPRSQVTPYFILPLNDPICSSGTKKTFAASNVEEHHNIEGNDESKSPDQRADGGVEKPECETKLEKINNILPELSNDSGGAKKRGAEKSSEKSASNLPPREQWHRKTEFLLAIIGFSVDLGNIWRCKISFVQNLKMYKLFMLIQDLFGL